MPRVAFNSSQLRIITFGEHVPISQFRRVQHCTTRKVHLDLYITVAVADYLHV